MPSLPPLHGWLVLDKPRGLGSTDAVGRVKRVLREGGYPRVKVGHGGTLDTLAHGVLPIALGEATKLAGRMLDASKAYSFTVAFGAETDTLDLDGEVIATSDVRPTLAEVKAVLPDFLGPIDQLPPLYSALKVAGRRASDRARAGEEVALAPRRITIHELRLGEPPLILPASAGGESPRANAAPPRDANPLQHLLGRAGGGPSASIRLHARVSKGTYIRALARDLAHALGAVGHVADLQRTAAGPFRLADATTLDRLGELGLQGRLHEAVSPLGAALDDIPALPVSSEQADRLAKGLRLAGIARTPGLHLATLVGRPVALVESDGAEVKVVRGFNLPDVEDENR